VIIEKIGSNKAHGGFFAEPEAVPHLEYRSTPKCFFYYYYVFLMEKHDNPSI
jgi:hypothetical protein